MDPIIPDYPPECPHCGALMRLILPPDHSKFFEPFWGCTQFANSECKGTRQVDLVTGLPTYTQEEEDFKALDWIRKEVYPDPGAEI